VLTSDKQDVHDSVDMFFARFLMLEDVVHDPALRSDIATLRKIAEKFERAV